MTEQSASDNIAMEMIFFLYLLRRNGWLKELQLFQYCVAIKTSARIVIERVGALESAGHMLFLVISCIASSDKTINKGLKIGSANCIHCLFKQTI